MDSILDRNVPVHMCRPHLDNVPEAPLPAGFTLRWFQPGDEQVWVEVQTRAERYCAISPGLFQREFGSHPEELPRRMCFLTAPGGLEIGTATAWFNPNYNGRPFGRIHWVAVVPEYQGRGLAKPLLTAVLHRLRELGHEAVYLATSTPRLAAINVYRKFGFVPDIHNEEDAGVWREWQAATGVDPFHS